MELIRLVNTGEKSKKTPNKALHLTAIPLRSIAAGELERQR
jgi:hypothetical protein